MLRGLPDCKLSGRWVDRTIRRMRRSLQFLCGAALAAVSNGFASAQQTYSLTEDDAWTLVAEPDPATPEGQLAIARQTLARNDPDRTIELATRWIDTNERHPLLAEAYLLRGDARYAQGDYYEALFDYEYIARSFYGSDVFVQALEREYDIAQKFATGTKRKLWGMPIIDGSDTAEELLIRIQERLGGSRLAEQAGMTLGDFYFSRGEMTLAAEAYELFIENYPKSEQIDKAKKRLIASQLALFKGPQFDPAGLYEARVRLREMKRFDPVTAEQIGADAILMRIDESDAVKTFTTAKWYYNTGDYISAEFLIRNLVQKYPRSVAAADAMRMIPEVLENLPANVLQTVPDYDAYRAAILGIEQPNAEDADVDDASAGEGASS